MARSYLSPWIAPFQALDDRRTAEDAGVLTSWVAIYLFLSHIGVLVLVGILPSYAPAMQTIQQVLNGIAGGFAALLAVLSWRSQPRWVAIVVLIWAALRLLLPVAAMLALRRFAPLNLVLPALATLYAVAGVRGAFAVAARRVPPVAVEVFE